MNNRLFTLMVIVVAGEAIFMLPFMIPRLYRPLMLEAWGLTNTDVGAAFSAYGITAMLSYILGGPFADKFHPKLLISLSLALTAIGSLYLVSFPSRTSLIMTYAFFGVSTILLLWGALIKTTHIAGGEEKRSTAMGVLDGGRGLSAAIASSVLVFLISLYFPTLDKLSDQMAALRIIYSVTAGFCLLTSLAVWLSLNNFHNTNNNSDSWEFPKAIDSLKNSQVWLLSIIILSSYCGYKSVDNYSTYLVDVQKQDLVNSSLFTSVIFWLRPIAALLAGIFADRLHVFNGKGRFQVLFILLLMSALFQLMLAYSMSPNINFAFTIILASATFAFSLRAIYFSVFGDLKIKKYLVGTTVGIVSFVGFMPDIFFGFITGYLIDSNPGELGFQNSFLFTAICLFAGVLASFVLYRQVHVKVKT